MAEGAIQLKSVPPPAANLEELRLAAEVLSTRDGPYPVRADLVDKMCLLDNGELLIAENSRLEVTVLAYEDELRRAQVEFRPVKVPLTKIREIYAAHAAKKRTPGGALPAAVSDRQTQVLNLIRTAVAGGASDLHIAVKGDIALIRSRIDGVLQSATEMPADDGKELCATIYQSMCDVAEPTYKPHQPQDGRLKEEFLRSAGLYGARVATRPTERGQLMVLRLLYSGEKKQSDLDALGYLPEQRELILRLTRRKNGINIFSGPTGSGKSTSLKVLLGQLVRNYEGLIHLLTIEDPPEYTIKGANQTPLGQGSWADAIRNAMRLDPDVMMIGEMRDLLSAQAAFQAALTGHGVWTTLHANDAITILQRLADLKLDPGLYGDPTLLTGLLNQNLARVLCPNCKKPWRSESHRVERGLVARVERFCDPANVYVRGPGCDRCGRRGIVGRQVIAEVIAPTLALMESFRRDGKAAARAFWLNTMGGISKTDHLLRCISDGRIDPAMGEADVGPLDDTLLERGTQA